MRGLQRLKPLAVVIEALLFSGRAGTLVIYQHVALDGQLGLEERYQKPMREAEI